MRGALVLMLFLGGDDFAAGVRAYEAGRFHEALAAFTAAEAEAGDRAGPAVLLNRALAAVRAGALRVAELSAERAAARGGPRFYGWRDFLRGNAAFARCERAAAQASSKQADPAGFVRAIVHCQAAARFWQDAAASRPDWPAARRNVERARRKLAALKEKKEEAEKRRKKKRGRKPSEQPNRREETERKPAAQRPPELLSRRDLERLLRRLDEKEKEKRALRRAQQWAQRIQVDKDW